jgi:uncharacterized membrane protein
MKTLAKNFLNGCLVLVPTVATLYAAYFVFIRIDHLIELPIPGAGFVLTIALITAIGALASNVAGRRLMAFWDRLIARLPLLRLVYTALRDLMAALVGEQRTFDRPVVATLSEDGAVKAIGFITRSDLSAWGLSDHVAVYFPQSINFAGQLLLLPRSRVTPLAAEPGAVLPFIVSGGIAAGTRSE